MLVADGDIWGNVPDILLEKLKKIHWKPVPRASEPAEIQTGNTEDTNAKHYFHTNLFDVHILAVACYLFIFITIRLFVDVFNL
jgi:hypothetical protein